MSVEAEILVFCSHVNQDTKQERGFICVSLGTDIASSCFTRQRKDILTVIKANFCYTVNCIKEQFNLCYYYHLYYVVSCQSIAKNAKALLDNDYSNV